MLFRSANVEFFPLSHLKKYFIRHCNWNNTREAVEILVDESIDAVKTLIDLGVEFTKEDGKYRRTREGGHSCFRIIHYQDRTGKSIMDGLIRAVKKRDNIDLLDWCHMVDIIEKHGQ